MKTGNERRTMRKVLLVIGILAAVLIPATAAGAGQVQEGRGQTWVTKPAASVIDPGRPCSPWRVCDNGNLIQPHIICWHVDGANSPCWTGSPFSWIPWVW